MHALDEGDSERDLVARARRVFGDGMLKARLLTQPGLEKDPGFVEEQRIEVRVLA